MVKKKDSSPLLSDEEIEDLTKDSIKREKIKRPIKKPIENLIEPKQMEKPKPKPVKKEVKKEQEKIVKALKNNEPITLIKTPEEIIKIPELELVLKIKTKYDLNWYFIKEKFIALKKWIFSPYTIYANWFNKKFNPPKPKPITIEDLYEDLPKMENKIHEDCNKILQERTRKIIIKEVK